MPKRGSREWLIHMLADGYAFAYREVYGDHRAYAQDFYDEFRRLSTPELKEMAAGLTPRRVGRPKAWWGRNKGSRYTPLFREVDKALASGKRSQRGAYKFVADQNGVSEKTLRTKHREWKRRG